MGTSILPQSTMPANGQAIPQNNNRTITLLFWFVALAAGAFGLSFNALFDLATKQGGIPHHLGWIWPVIVDLSLCVYTAAILVAQLQSRPAKFPVGLVIFYGLVTILGNVLHAPQTPVGWFVASLPPLSLIFGTEVLRTMAHHIIERQNVTASLADLTATADEKRQQIADLDQQNTQAQAQADSLTAKVDTLQAEVKQLQQQKRQAAKEQPADYSPQKIEQARQIITQWYTEGRRGRQINGSELGRMLGISERSGRDLKNKLLPEVESAAVLLNSNGKESRP